MQTTRLLVLWATVFTANTMTIKAQENLSSDDLLKKARTTAFDQKNYPGAIGLCQQALQKSPGYTDIKVFLGRLYFWNDQKDSSRIILDEAMQSDPKHEDAAIAAGSIAYFNDQYQRSLEYCNQGLMYHPQSEELLLQKTKSLIELKRYTEALTITDSLLHKNYNLKDVRALVERVKDHRSKNKIGISYDYTHFQNQFDNPWHLASLDYTRQTNIGSFAGRVNYGNRFNESGVQFEADAYPSISKRLYAYINLGYSPDLPIFAKFRSGFSLYANLPAGFEADAGFRFLRFSENTWIYTGSVGKYYKNWWFNLRAYLTPDNDRISHSYSFSGRYYLGGADDYFSFSVGTGLSPDDRNQAVQLNSNYKLISRKASVGYRFSCKKLNIFSIGLGYANVEYLPKIKDNQVNASISYQRRF